MSDMKSDRGSNIEAGRRLPALALRQRSADHPMAMFAVIAGSALFSMAMASSSGIAAGAPRTATLDIANTQPASPKSARLVQSDAKSACEGQAWGGESAECLMAIVRESGEVRSVRLVVASADIAAVTPNVF